MKVILLQDVKGSGKKGDVVDVSDGYARNFLFKKKLAEQATSVTINSVKIKKDAEAFHLQEEKNKAMELAKELKSVTITLKVKCGENGKVFGSITSKEIAEELNRLNYPIDKKKIVLKEPIKNTGAYILDIKIMADIASKITLIVENA